jgi:hypothetical protein
MRALIYLALVALVSVVPASYFADLPELMQQYRQRIGGIVSELRNVLRDFDEDARRWNLNRDAALRMMEGKPEPFFHERAARVRGYERRLARLEEQEDMLRYRTSPFTVIAFYQSYNEQIYKETLVTYKPAINGEGIQLAALTWLLAMSILGAPAILLAGSSREVA